MSAYDVLCVGSATVDRFLTIEQSLSSIALGDKVLVTSSEIHSGGGASNAAAALSKLGLQARMLTKLGNDHDAEFILKEMKQYNVRNLCRHHSRKSTDFSTIISSTQEKDRIIFVHKGASADLLNYDYSMAQVAASRWIYMATLVGKSFSTAKQIASFAARKKIKLLFNPSLYLAKKGKALRPLLRAATVLVLNKEEAEVLLGTTIYSLKKMALALHALGPEIVVITDGPNKVVAYADNVLYSFQPPQVKVVHTAGAGDAFTAGFLVGIIKKYPLEDALRLGQVNALSVIQHIGTKNKLLTAREAAKLSARYKIRVHQDEI